MYEQSTQLKPDGETIKVKSFKKEGEGIISISSSFEKHGALLYMSISEAKQLSSLLTQAIEHLEK